MDYLKHLSWIFVFALFFLEGTLTNLFGQESVKPTREQVVRFLEEYQKNHPLTEEEKKVGRDRREKLNLTEVFGRDYSGLDLSGIDFKALERGILIPNADFSGCNLQRASLYGADLRNCNFSNTDLSNAKLWFCELHDSDFSGSKLDGTKFAYCKMHDVRFENLNVSSCEFEAVDFHEARLSGTKFSGAKFVHRRDFAHAKLARTDLSSTSLPYADFRGADLENADFTNSDLHLADFTGANLKDASFMGANLEYADFTDVKGIDDDQRKQLEKITGRWWYDLKEKSYDFLCVIFMPAYFIVAVVAIVSSVVGICYTKKSAPFLFSFAMNGFAIFSTLCTFVMMFSGGHPVKQMSQGNYDAWSTWLHFYPIPLFGLMLCILVVGILGIATIGQMIFVRDKPRPWKLFSYHAATLVHCLLAFNWLLVFMPDA